MWIFPKSVGVICKDRRVITEANKSYFKDGCLMHSHRTIPVVTSFFDSMKWSYYQKHVNQITLNGRTLKNLALPIFEVFIWSLLDMNLSLNQILPTFLLYVRQTWLTQLSLAISPWGVIFLLSERILFCYSCAYTCSLYEGRTSPCTGLISRKRSEFLFMFLIAFTSFSVLLLFPQSITFFVLYTRFLMLFHVT